MTIFLPMDATLQLSSNAMAYADLGATSNPLKRFVDWSVQRRVAVKNAKAEPYTVDPGATQVLFSGLRSTSADATTQLQLTLSPLAPTRYRMTWTAIGTAPAFRADRGVAASGHTITVTAQPNMTVQMVSSTPGDFAGIVAGDTVFIPDVLTGDSASPFNPLNVGYWVVLANSANTLQLARPSNVPYTASSESVLLTSDGQLVAFGAAGVQVGDSAVVGASFPAAAQGRFAVLAVTPTWFEFSSTVPLPAPVSAAGSGSSAAVLFYSNAKRYVRCELDQRCQLQLNGVTLPPMEPWAGGDPDLTGFYESPGPVWGASVTNLTGFPLNFLFISAE